MRYAFHNIFSTYLAVDKLRVNYLPLILVITSAIVTGIVASTGNLILAGLFIAGITGVIISFSRVVLLWVVILIGLVAAGLTQLYVPQIQLVRWLVIPAGLALIVHALFEKLSISSRDDYFPGILWWALAFITINIVSILLNYSRADVALFGLKGYFQIWSVLFALALIDWPERVMQYLPKIFFGVALLQMPFVLHQYFFLVPNRVGLGDGVVPVDIVAGTFGASAEGGGANAALATFLFITLAGLVSLLRENVISFTKCLAYSIPLMIPVLLNEAKVSVLYMLTAFIVLFRNDIFLTPIKFLGASLLSIVVLGILMTAYTLHAPANKDVDNWLDLLQYTYAYNIQNEETWNRELTRSGAYKYWFSEHGIRNLPQTLLGHGAGVTRSLDTSAVESEVRVDEVELGIGITTVTAVLWESGIIGIICLFGLMLSSFMTAGRLANNCQSKYSKAIFRGAQASIAVIFISLWHKNFFVFHISYQTFFVILFGFLAYWDRMLHISYHN